MYEKSTREYLYAHQKVYTSTICESWRFVMIVEKGVYHKVWIGNENIMLKVREWESDNEDNAFSSIVNALKEVVRLLLF